MRLLLFQLLFLFTISASFAQNKQVVKRYGFSFEIPADWEVEKYKEHTLIMDPKGEVFVTVKKFARNNEGDEAMLKELMEFIMSELKNYIPSEVINKKIVVKPAKEVENCLYIGVEGEPDEDNEVTIYSMYVYKRKKYAVAFSIIDFGEAPDPNNEFDFLMERYLFETTELINSIKY